MKRTVRDVTAGGSRIGQPASGPPRPRNDRAWVPRALDVLGEEDDEPEFAHEHPAAERVLRSASVIGALVLLVLTAVLVSARPLDTDLASVVQTSPSPVASTLTASTRPAPSPTTIGPEPASYRGTTSTVIGPLNIAPGSYDFSWTASGGARRCVFGVRLRPGDAASFDVVPIAVVPHGGTVSGSTQTSIATGVYHLEVTASGCQWRVRIHRVDASPGM
jgi:hypothetical protein